MNTVFVDIDTQIDFLYPAGALYVPGAEKLAPVIAALNRYAAAHGIPVVSTADAHTENDPEFREWPPHCVAGTTGQQKAQATLLDRRVVIPVANGQFDVSGAQQIIVEKHVIDIFKSPNLPAVLKKLGGERYVVYGVVTEYCVRYGALGLLRMGGKVELVTDAIETLDPAKSREVMAEVTANGGKLVTAAEILR